MDETHTHTEHHHVSWGSSVGADAQLRTDHCGVVDVDVVEIFSIAHEGERAVLGKQEGECARALRVIVCWELSARN